MSEKARRAGHARSKPTPGEKGGKSPTKMSRSKKSAMPVQLRLKLANECDDPLAASMQDEHKPAESDGQRQQPAGAAHPELNYRSVRHEEADLIEWMLNLTEANMAELYEASTWGWKRSFKSKQ